MTPWRVGYKAIKANALPMVALWLLAATPDAAGHAAFGEPVRVPQVGPKGMAVALEGNRLFAGAGATLYALDVTDPLKPRLLGSLDGFDNLRQMCVRGRFAYVVSRETGMRIVDVSDPANMRIRALYDTVAFAPGGTGHRDMVRSESSARELGRPVLRKQGAGVGWSRSSDEAGNDRGAKGSCLHGVSNGDGGTRLADKAHDAKRRKTMYPERDNGWCTAPRTSWEKLAAKAGSGSRVRLRGITNMLGSGGSPALRGNARTWERAGAGERRRPERTTRGTRT